MNSRVSSLELTRKRLSKRLALNKEILKAQSGHSRVSPLSTKGSCIGRSTSILQDPFSFSGKSDANLLGKLLDINTVIMEEPMLDSTEALLLQVSTFSFQTDNKYVSLPCYSKDAHKILLYGERPRDRIANILHRAGVSLPQRQFSLSGRSLESRNIMLWVKGSIGLHSSYVAMYKKKVSEPCIHVYLPLDRLLIISSDH